jgi:hypothetical protein
LAGDSLQNAHDFTASISLPHPRTEAGGREFGCNFLKLSPDFSQVDWFAPANVKQLNSDILDIDLGSAGPVLLGSNEIGGGGKQGKLYLVQRSSLGHQQQHRWLHDQTNPPIQFFWAARPLVAIVPLRLVPHQFHSLRLRYRVSSHPRLARVLGRFHDRPPEGLPLRVARKRPRQVIRLRLS